MSNTSKHNLKRLVTKKKSHRPLRLTKKRDVPLPERASDEANQNSESSVAGAALLPPEPGHNLGEHVILNMFKTQNLVLYQGGKESKFNLMPGPPAQLLRSRNHHIRFEQLQDYLANRLGHSSARSTISQYVTMLTAFLDFNLPPSFGATVEDDL